MSLLSLFLEKYLPAAAGLWLVQEVRYCSRSSRCWHKARERKRRTSLACNFCAVLLWALTRARCSQPIPASAGVAKVTCDAMWLCCSACASLAHLSMRPLWSLPGFSPWVSLRPSSNLPSPKCRSGPCQRRNRKRKVLSPTSSRGPLPRPTGGCSASSTTRQPP